MDSEWSLSGYALMAEAVARLTLTEEQEAELICAACDQIREKTRDGSTYDCFAELVSFAYRAGAAAALICAEQRKEELAQEFSRLLDLPGENG